MSAPATGGQPVAPSNADQRGASMPAIWAHALEPIHAPQSRLAASGFEEAGTNVLTWAEAAEAAGVSKTVATGTGLRTNEHSSGDCRTGCSKRASNRGRRGSDRHSNPGSNGITCS